MMYETNKETFIYKLIVFLTFMIAGGLYYSNPDQFISQNSFFYPVVAQHFLWNGVSTFNGYIETNAYEPLWMLFCIFATYLSSILSLNNLIVIGVIYHLFLIGSIIILFKISNRWSFFSVPVMSLVLIFIFISNGFLHNMESALALFMILLTLYYVLSTQTPLKINFFIIGLLLGGTFLSRLDLVFFDTIVLLYLLFIHRKKLKERPVSLVYLLVGILIIVLPYIMYNQLNFGNVLPMEEIIKEGFPTIDTAIDNIYPYGTVIFCIALIEWVVAWMLTSHQARVIILILSLSTITQIFYIALFQKPESWYFITGFINTAFLISYFSKKINLKWFEHLVITSLFLLIIVTSYLKVISNYTLSAHFLKLYTDKRGEAPWIFSKKSFDQIFSEKIKSNLPENSSVYSWNHGGSLSYYTKLNVFTMDGFSEGIIKNQTLEKLIKKEGVKKVFDMYEISYIIFPLTLSPWRWNANFKFEPVNKEKFRLIFCDTTVEKDFCFMEFSYSDIIYKMKPNPNSSVDFVILKRTRSMKVKNNESLKSLIL